MKRRRQKDTFSFSFPAPLSSSPTPAANGGAASPNGGEARRQGASEPPLHAATLLQATAPAEPHARTPYANTHLSQDKPRRHRQRKEGTMYIGRPPPQVTAGGEKGPRGIGRPATTTIPVAGSPTIPPERQPMPRRRRARPPPDDHPYPAAGRGPRATSTTPPQALPTNGHLKQNN